MEYLFIYLLQVADIISAIAVILSVIPIFVQVIRWIADCGSSETLFTKKYMKPTIVCWVISVILFLVPAKQTVLLMGGTYMAKKTVSSIATDSRMSKVNAIIDLQLDKCLKDLKQEVR